MPSRCNHFLLFIAILCCVSSCNTKHENILLKPEAYQTSLSGTKDAVIIDVRTPEEFNDGHLKDALNYNIYDSDFTAHLSSIDKNKPVYVYCKKGGRSTDAADQLQAMGYKHLYNLEGGYAAWEGRGLPVEK